MVVLEAVQIFFRMHYGLFDGAAGPQFIFGILFSLIAVIGIVFVIVRQAVWGGSAYGWASTVCIILFVAGIQLFCIGILGQYLAKTYLETKRRPVYLVRETEEGVR